MNFKKLLPFCLIFLQISTSECSGVVKRKLPDSTPAPAFNPLGKSCCTCHSEVLNVDDFFRAPYCCKCNEDDCGCGVSYFRRSQGSAPVWSGLTVGYCRPCGCECGSGLISGGYVVAYCHKCGCACGSIFLEKSQKVGCFPCNCGCGIHDTGKGYARCTICKQHAPGCFSSAATVSLQNGKMELQVGDRVETLSASGNIRFSEVKSFMKKDHATVTMYKSIRASGKTIRLTGNHLIYSRRYSLDKFNFIYADEVSINDEVLVMKNSDFIPAKVTNISTSMMQGAFAAVTVDGNIVVDGILASCYAFPDHDFVHFGMTPIHLFPRFLELILGDNKGSPVFVEIAKNIGKFILPLNLYEFMVNM